MHLQCMLTASHGQATAILLKIHNYCYYIDYGILNVAKFNKFIFWSVSKIYIILYSIP
jgi:hypothetical protein